MSTYNDVVSEAADEAGGQGFVTEFAQASDTLDDVILQQWETDEFDRIVNQQFDRPADFLFEAVTAFGSWDGFQDAVRGSVTLPDDITLEDFLRCLACYASDERVTFDEAGFRVALYEDVYRPMLEAQELLQSRPYVTRLYTTMSAEEMTMDPAFNFNADLRDVSNVHTAEQIIDCDGGFRVMLPQGETVHGQEQGAWPNELADEDLPAARKILQLATEGQGEVVQDNSDAIADFLRLRAPGSGGANPDRDAGSAGSGSNAGADGGDSEGTLGGSGSDGCSCSTALGAASSRAGRGAASCALLALGWFAVRRRRR
jgi:hypothetical protein